MPDAFVIVLGPLEAVLGDEELNTLLRQRLAGDTRVEFLDLSEQYRQGGIAALESALLSHPHITR